METYLQRSFIENPESEHPVFNLPNDLVVKDASIFDAEKLVIEIDENHEEFKGIYQPTFF